MLSILKKKGGEKGEKSRAVGEGLTQGRRGLRAKETLLKKRVPPRRSDDGPFARRASVRVLQGKGSEKRKRLPNHGD